MTESDRKDAAPLLALAVAAAVAIVVYNAPRWAQSLAELAVQPATVTLVAALVLFALVVLTARLVVTRRALDRRARLLMVPADSFDPAPEAIVNFASGLSRSRRTVRGMLDAPASAVRVALDADPSGRLRYTIELPDRARGVLRTATAGYHGVELHETDRAPDSPPAGNGVEVARAELVLARPSSEPLRDAGLDPDPLAAFARALGQLHGDQGDTAIVCIDLLPVTPGRRRRLRRRLLRQARRHHPAPAPVARPDGSLGDLLPVPRDVGRAAPSELVERRADQRALTGKLGTPEPLFAIQILIRVASPEPGRAKAQIGALLAAFDTYAGYNHLRVSGVGLPGLTFLGSDLPGRRQRFDRRIVSGLFRPARRGVVTASEIAGLLKPPTAKCHAHNVLRSGGIVGPPPPGLPTFTGQPGLLPLGRVADETGERIVGVPLADTFFSYMAGRSRFGKTETAIGQFVHLARTGHGCLFLDPHEDALHKIKGYLTDNGLRDRVVEINLADPDQQPGWNLFAASDGAATQERVDATVDAFASALRWDETNTRALNLTTQAAQALCDLAGRLPAEFAPTIFQIPTLLSNDEWRAAVLSHVSPPTREFFENRFPRLSPEAVTPVTNLIDRLRVSPPAAALLGNPLRSYDIRQAMDQGQVVLVCPGSGSARDRLIANFVVYDVLHSAKSRANLPPDRRREFHVFLDEVQTYDGASSGTLAALLEQVAKFGVRVHLFNQNPERLTTATLNAVTTNRSHLLTTALNAKAATLLARDLGGQIDPQTIASLERFHSIGSITLAGETSPPFRIHGVPTEELFPDVHQPDRIADLNAAIACTTCRAPIGDTLSRLADHDAAILAHLRRPSDPAATGGRRRIQRKP